MNEYCPVHEVSHMLGRKIAIPLLDELNKNTEMGFNELIRRIGVTPKVLSERMKEMEDQKIVEKNEREKYVLTFKGKELCEIMDSIKRFQVKWKAIPENCVTNVCAECKLVILSKE